MSNFYLHLIWFYFLSTLTLISIILSFLVTFNYSIFISFHFLSLWNLPLSLSLNFDQFSCWFMSVVLLISSVIIIYSFFYISPYFKSHYFLVLTLFFIISMLLVICFRNLIFIMLGWDGLGLVSFFLIVYYQNPSSIFSGLFTLLINRIGDAFFLCSIVLYSYFSFDYFIFFSDILPFISVVFLVITFITKRAIFPFSPWLPMAIAAPTPISALVHSSTLVTSGLFLIIKYSYVLYSYSSIISFLLVSCIFTSFYAGINTIFEKDFKKLIALSTLSHLGFIGMSFSLGLLNLAFFHLLTHALFKSVLFITIGEIIINLHHSQDTRFLSQGANFTPFSCYIINISLLNLLGFPRLCGFWSKDLILESINYTQCRFFLYYLRLINLFFTFYYSFQLFYYSFQLSKTTSFFMFHPMLFIHSLLTSTLSIFSLFFGYFFLDSFTTLFFPILPLLLKLFPLMLIFVFLVFLIFNKSLFTSTNQFLNSYFSSIIFLYFFITKLSSNMYYSSIFWLTKSVELGVFNSYLNTQLSSFSFLLRNSLLKISTFPPLLVSTFSLLSIFFILNLF